MDKDKTSELQAKILEALKEYPNNTEVLYFVAEISTFICMSGAETLTEALDYWDSFHTAGRNHIKRTFGKAYEFMRERELEKDKENNVVIVTSPKME